MAAPFSDYAAEMMAGVYLGELSEDEWLQHIQEAAAGRVPGVLPAMKERVVLARNTDSFEDVRWKMHQERLQQKAN